MIDLADYVPALQREVNPPGVDLLSGATAAELVGHLSDAFWEARLDGFLTAWTCDEDGVVTPVDPLSAVDIPRDALSLVVLYAGIRVIRNRILNTNAVFRAKAGSVEYETGTSAQMLTEMLKQLKAAKDRYLERATDNETPVGYYDALSVRSFSDASYYGSSELADGLL